MADNGQGAAPQQQQQQQQQLLNRFVQLCSSSPDPNGIHDNTLKAEFGDLYPNLVTSLNSLLAENRLVLKEGADHSLWYKLVEGERAQKLNGLTPEQMMIFQVIERSGNKGIWTRDIKNHTSVQQQTLTKGLKVLEGRQLVKSVKSVTSKSKKLYMLYDLAPSKEITGGPWYTEQEFDHEFIEALSKFITAFVKDKLKASLDDITDRVKVSGISKVELSREDVKLVVNTLVFDGALEEVRGFSNALGVMEFKVAQNINRFNQFTDVPCGVCPVVDQCCENGVISPATCVYLTKWLDLPDDPENLF